MPYRLKLLIWGRFKLFLVVLKKQKKNISVYNEKDK